MGTAIEHFATILSTTFAQGTMANMSAALESC